MSSFQILFVASRRGSGSFRFAIISVVLELGGFSGCKAGESVSLSDGSFYAFFDEIATETDTFILASAVSSSLSSCCVNYAADVPRNGKVHC